MHTDERIDGVNRFMGRRPLALWAMLYCAGALAGYYGAVPLWLWMALSGAAVLGLAVLRRKVWVFVLALMFGGLISCAAAIVPGAVPMDDVRIEGRVAVEPNWNGDRAAVVLTDVSVGGQPHGRDLRVYLYGAPVSARIGDRLSFLGDTWLPQGRRNPHGFDFRAWLWTRGGVLCATGNAQDAAVSTPDGLSYWTALGAVRAFLGARADALFPGDAPLVRALVLGDRAALDEGMQDDFRAAGLAHLLAISGLHVGCLALALEFLLRALGCSRRGAIWATLLALGAYAALIGFPAPVVRSVLMFLAVRGAILLGRPQDSLTGLAAAFLALVLYRPLSIADAGFQMSFGAVLGLLLLTEPIAELLHVPKTMLWPGFSDRRRILRWFLAGVMALLVSSLAAQLIMLPVIAQTFGAVTPLAPLVNILAIPLSTALMPLAVLKLIFGLGWFMLPDLMLSWLADLAAIAARMPGHDASLPVWPQYLVGVYLALCVLASPYMRIAAKRRHLLICALPVLALCSMLLARWALPGGLNIAFLDAGQANAAVVRAEGISYVVDLGKDGGPAVDYLVRTGQRPKAVFLTHPHADHCGGLEGLLSAMRPEVIYIPECWDRTEAEGDVQAQLARAESMGTRIERLAAGDRVALSDHVVAEVIQPQAGYVPKAGNGASLVLAIRYGEGSALLPGDLPSAEEMQSYPDVSVLAAAHHGSGSSTSERMMRMAAPSVVVFSVGRNGYGHPAARVLDRAARAGAAIYRTDQGGCVTADIREDGVVHMQQFLEDAA